MARNHEDLDDDMRSAGSITGVRTTVSEEARDVRNAGRKLASSDDDDGDLLGAVTELKGLIAEQKASNEAIAKQMRHMVYTMRDVLDEVQKIKADAQDTSHSARQAALDGVTKAQKDAEEVTIKNINEVTVRSTKYIETMVQESKRRIERLAMITLPDRLFHFGKWVALVLVLFILTHVVWQMMAG